MNPIPRKLQKDDSDLILNYLSAGGKVTVSPPGAVSENLIITGGFYGRRPKKTEPTEGADE